MECCMGTQGLKHRQRLYITVQMNPEIVRTASVTMTVPKYRLSEGEKGCNHTCAHWRDSSYCAEYYFKCDSTYTCDSWKDSGI